MPKQAAAIRRRNFDEVALGYSEEQAIEEAGRCIQCKKPGCIKGCPVEVNIPEFIKAVHEGDMPEAARIIKSTNSLPAICGRVCPQETQCEVVCALNKKGAPSAIGRLERYVADWERAHPEVGEKQKEHVAFNGKKVAVVGSGPAGLTCAADLAK
ncbi:MAG: dihydropyrimidine dehydrogenase, partial [Dehalococcoidales bacterium]|nr:dihydropyrimidine dehydrogenase [Dehalococcoidales bacterium]